MFFCGLDQAFQTALAEDTTAKITSTTVLLASDMFHPVDHSATFLLLNGDVRHRRCRCRPMPVLFAGREPDHVTGTDLFDRASFTLGPPAARRDDESLTQWMGVPGRPRPRLEGHAGTRNESRVGRLKKRIDANSARKPLRRSLADGSEPTRLISMFSFLTSPDVNGH